MSAANNINDIINPPWLGPPKGLKNAERRYLKFRCSTLTKVEKQTLPWLSTMKQWLREMRETNNKLQQQSQLPAPVMASPPKSVTYHGPPLRIPSDKSVIEEVKEAMRAYPKHKDAAARAISMGNANYAFLVKLITISDYVGLPREDREKLNECFENIEKTRQLYQIRKIGEDIIARHWIKRQAKPHIINHRRKRFDKTITAIHESCDSTIEMHIPHDLSREEVFRAIGTLSRSAELIGQLIGKLVGEKREK